MRINRILCYLKKKWDKHFNIEIETMLNSKMSETEIVNFIVNRNIQMKIGYWFDNPVIEDWLKELFDDEEILEKVLNNKEIIFEV